MRTRILGATVVFPNEIAVCDVVIEGTKIADVDAAKSLICDEVVDARGRCLLPGVVDDQVHFREPGLTHKEDLWSASRACAKGGVTSFLEMPNTQPPTVTREALQDKLDRAAKNSLVNYGFYLGATATNLTELQHGQRTPGIKIFMGSSTGDLLVQEQELLESIFAATTLPICAHCEDEPTIRANRDRLVPPLVVSDHSRIRDRTAAIRATQRAVGLAHRHRHRFHVLHVSTADELAIVADHRGLVTAEVCPHHLFFHEGDYGRLGSLVQMNPSLKTAQDNQELWQGLLDGRIQVIATDHAPHTLEEKQRPYPDSPSGLPCVENSLALMLHQVNLGRCTLLDVAHWMSDAPARVWDILNKGRILSGYDADLVLVDMQAEQTIRNAEQFTKCRWSPWDGVTLRGWPIRTWVRGQEVFREGRIIENRAAAEIQFDHARGGYWSDEQVSGTAC